MKKFNWVQRTHEPFIYLALLVALTAGFGYGALMVAAVALGIIPGVWWGAVVQAHGHAQLFGWLGLFVLGMGLYFLPRLRGVTLQEASRTPYVIGLVGGGLALRVIAQPWLGFNSAGEAAVPLVRLVWGLSAALELAGAFVIVSILRATLQVAKPVSPGSPGYASEPFIRIAFVSLVLAMVFNAGGVWNAIAQGHATLAWYYDNPVISLMLYGVAIPMAIVFSVRNLPLFLRLAQPPRESLRILGYAYGIGLALTLAQPLGMVVNDLLQTLHRSLLSGDVSSIGLVALAKLGSFVLDVCILVFIWQVDIFRRRPPWIVNRAPNTRPDLDYLRKPTRANYPDAGEYGRFELLVYSAYGWLIFAVVLDLGRLLAEFTGWLSISADSPRHALAVGFVTLLIFGMSARMVPGFSHKKRVAFPQLVAVTFVLGNAAAFLRVVPTLFPAWEFALQLWGLSGVIGWVAVAVLAVNLVAIFRRA